MTTQYDGVPYPGHPYPQSYPNRLATHGLLFGLQPAEVTQCRVLEIGCGDGENILPLASAFPHSRFVGIDLAASAIARGNALGATLGLKNLTLRHLDINAVTRELGEFDYIIAHGVYSWVPPELRGKILAICRENLAPHGIAYVSYNAYPGGHLRNIVSEMMKFHVRGGGSASEKISQSRSLMKFLSDASAGHSKYGDFLKFEFERVQTSDDALIFHDDLSEFRTPFYFHQFMAEASRHGLQFLAEADYSEMQSSIYPPEVVEKLAQLNHDILLKEQYLDFLKCRAFRQTLLVHRDVVINRTPQAAAIMNFHIGSRAQPVSPHPNLAANAVEEFKGVRGGAVKTDHALTKAALLHLGRQWPKLTPFQELYDQACALLGSAANQEPSELSETLLQLYSAGVVELHVHAPAFTLQVSECPTASPLARQQVRSNTIVTALNYASVKLEDSLSRSLLWLLDGTRDRAALKRDLAQLIRAGNATVPTPSGNAAEEAEKIVAIMENRLEANLERFARFPLLIR